jgi:hypothetical protein
VLKFLIFLVKFDLFPQNAICHPSKMRFLPFGVFNKRARVCKREEGRWVLPMVLVVVFVKILR